MSIVNKFLGFANLKLNWVQKKKTFSDSELSFLKKYEESLATARGNDRGFEVISEYVNQSGDHPKSHIECECNFAAEMLSRFQPDSILDIGSYREFILGILSSKKVTTLDVRAREPTIGNEKVVTYDAKNLDFLDNSFDAVVSLCSIEHFGLGRYGDDFDLDADKKAMKEMIRVLKPGGCLIISTTITKAVPSIVFNLYRAYSTEMIKDFFKNMEKVEEKYWAFNDDKIKGQRSRAKGQIFQLLQNVEEERVSVGH